jgi:hypothetical protein
MIPVQPQPEPEIFSARIRERGRQFLHASPHPTMAEWNTHAYWRDILPDLRKAYRGICAYSAQWIPPDIGSDSVDHFVPKTINPGLAYEWQNYRYASLRFNARKSTHVVLDPFQIEWGWFVLDFPSLLVKPHADLPKDLQEAINSTISVFRFNSDEGCVESRQHWLEAYCRYDISFTHLESRAPFIAFELKRQQLQETIRQIMLPGR